jgi:HAD superfamily hydrolase (TIGR01490 family)
MSRAAAFFDVDGTIVTGNIVRYYADLRGLDAPRWRRAATTLGVALHVPRFLWLDARDRGSMQRAVYALYRGFDAAELEQRARTYFEQHLRARLFAGALGRIAEHHRRGERVVLVSGSLRPLVAPLAEHVAASDFLCSELETRDGVCTGRLLEPPLAGARKAAAVAAYIERHGLEREACCGYADSNDDIAMLAAVGQPSVVNPGRRLRRIAVERGWTVLRWSPAAAPAAGAARASVRA